MVRPWRRRVVLTGGRTDPGLALLILWTTFIIYVTMLPFGFDMDAAEAARKLRAMGGSFGRPISRTDAVSNVLLFVPLGALLSFRVAGRGTGLGMTLVVAALGGLALSILVECGQLFLPSRVPSLVDLTTNTAGATLGALAGWPFIRRVWPAWSPAVRVFVRRRPMAACALAAAVGLGVAGLAPFDVSLDPGDVKAALNRARPIPFGPPLRGPTPPAEPWSWAGEALTWILAGGLVTLALSEARRGGSRAVAKAVALSGALSLAIEASQVVIPSRNMDMTSVLLALTGSATGAMAVAGFPRRDPRRWTGPALLIWGIAVLLAAWTPPVLVSPSAWSLRPWQFVPFWVYYERTDLSALADDFNQALSFVPLGALLAARDARGSVRRALLLGLGVGLVLEAGQLALADRTAEITDALSAAAGAALGAWLWEWGASIRGEESGARRYRVR
jgi:glycopeptide antibiotics resistance protein